MVWFRPSEGKRERREVGGGLLEPGGKRERQKQLQQQETEAKKEELENVWEQVLQPLRFTASEEEREEQDDDDEEEEENEEEEEDEEQQELEPLDREERLQQTLAGVQKRRATQRERERQLQLRLKEEEERREAEERRLPRTFGLTDADILPAPLTPTPVLLPPLSYRDSNGAANSFLQANAWWAQAADLQPLELHDPRRIPEQGDRQFETAVRLAESAPQFVLKDRPGQLKASTAEKMKRQMRKMKQIARGARDGIEAKLTAAESSTGLRFDRKSLRALRVGHLLKQQSGVQRIEDYHTPQLTQDQQRSFLLSLDKSLLPLPLPREESFSREEAASELARYLRKMGELSYVENFLLKPAFLSEEEEETGGARAWRRHWNTALRRDEEQQLVNLDALEADSPWLPLQLRLQEDEGQISPLMWEAIVLKAAVTGTMPWSGSYWSPERAQLLLSYLLLLQAVLQSYNDVVEHVLKELDDDVKAGSVPRSQLKQQAAQRVSARVTPFVLALRQDEYSLPESELSAEEEQKLNEMVLNAFYGVERDSSGKLTSIVQDASLEESEELFRATEALRLLPLYQPDLLPSQVNRVTTAGLSLFDPEQYRPGSYDFVNQIRISEEQAEVLGTAALDRKVAEFRQQLLAALQRYRQVNKREPLLDEQLLPRFRGHDPNESICMLAEHLRTASSVDVAAVLKEAVRSLPRSSVESRRQRRVSEFLFYYAVATKLYLFEDNYMEAPEKESEAPKLAAPAVSRFLKLEAKEEPDEEESEAEARVSLGQREAMLEKRLLRVAAELFTPNNPLSEFQREPDSERKRETASEGLMLQFELENGLLAIRRDTLLQLEQYEEQWLSVKQNVEKAGGEGWGVPVPERLLPQPEERMELEQEKRVVVLQGAEIVNAIPYVQDIKTVQQLASSGFTHSFSTAVSVRELMQRSRAALPDAPPNLSQPFPLLVEGSEEVDRKQRALQVVRSFLLSGQLLPSNVDSLAGGLTLLQLLRLLSSNAPQPLSSTDMVELLESEERPTRLHGVQNEEELPYALLLSCIQGEVQQFRDSLFYASLQDIRLAAAVGLQLDYWLSEEKAAQLAADIRNDLTQELLQELLQRDPERVASYNAGVRSVNRTVKTKSLEPPLLMALGPYGVLDYLREEDYGSLSLEALQAELAAGAIVYTPWLSSQQAIRLYLSARGGGAVPHELANFVQTAAGDTLASYYRRTGCEKQIVLDLSSKHGLSPNTFSLLNQHSLLYDGQEYESLLEAVTGYFVMTADTLRKLDKRKKESFQAEASEAQKRLWRQVLQSLESKQRQAPDKEPEVILDEVLSELNKKNKSSMVTLLQMQTESSLKRLTLEADQRLHQAVTPGKHRAYTGYILSREVPKLDGSLQTLYSPLYPKYRRLLKRLLTAVKQAQKEDRHWLELWSPQYRVRSLLTMKQQADGSWQAQPLKGVEAAFTLKDLLGTRKFDGLKKFLPQPPITPDSFNSTLFYGFGRDPRAAQESREKAKEIRPELELIAHIMEIAPAYRDLVLLGFIIPDARTAAAYSILDFALAVQTMQDIDVVRHVTRRSLQQEPQQVVAEIQAYIEKVRLKFQDALKELQKGEGGESDVVREVALLFKRSASDPELAADLELELSDPTHLEEKVRLMFRDALQELQRREGGESDVVREVALLFKRSASDPELAADLELELSDLTHLEGFLAMLRYPFTSGGGFSINAILKELSREPAVTAQGHGVYHASFLQTKSSMTLPGPLRKERRAAEEQELPPPPESRAQERQQPPARRRRIVPTEEEEEDSTATAEEERESRSPSISLIVEGDDPAATLERAREALRRDLEAEESDEDE